MWAPVLHSVGEALPELPSRRVLTVNFWMPARMHSGLSILLRRGGALKCGVSPLTPSDPTVRWVVLRPEQFRLAGERGAGQAGRLASVDKTANGPLFPASLGAITR